MLAEIDFSVASSNDATTSGTGNVLAEIGADVPCIDEATESMINSETVNVN